MNWHRLFGLALADFFAGSPFAVEIELDLSIKKQLLDVVVLRKTVGEFAGRLPDGLDDLADFNLITFKSHQQALDGWALLELLGHYVNYRKQVSPSLNELRPERDFRLYAICARFPQGLAGEIQLDEVWPGVYQCRWGTAPIRIIVTSRLPEEDHNAVLHLFSAQPERVRYGAAHYRQRSNDTSTLIYSLFEHYQLEGVAMPYTMEEFKREFVKEHLDELSPEERLKGLPPEERLKGLPPEERLKGLPPEERLKGLPPEDRLKGLPPEERLKGLSVEDLTKALSHEEFRALVEKLKQREET
jgi:hypothetical protein